ncbi:MAG: PEP-CTERM sorting domain-containing protein [Terriglobia bacterium]
MKGNRLAVLILAAAVGFASAAMADGINFSFSGGGISASGAFTASQTSPGVDEITGISGTFSDSNVGISGAITGLHQPVTYVNTLPGVQSTAAHLSYDDLFFPAGNSPADCPGYPFSGGQLDIFGVAFNLSGPGGYVAALWSNGYLPDSNGTMPNTPGYVPNLVYAAGLTNATSNIDLPNASPTSPIPPGEFGSLTTSSVPEPGSLVFFGIGLLGIMTLWMRKINPLRSPRM